VPAVDTPANSAGRDRGADTIGARGTVGKGARRATGAIGAARSDAMSIVEIAQNRSILNRIFSLTRSVVWSRKSSNETSGLCCFDQSIM
jgi:hypothetical protein